MKGILGVIKNIALKLAGITPVATLISTLYPASSSVVSTFNAIVDLVKQTEGIATAVDANVTGEQKLAAATPYAVALIKGSEALAGHDIVDENAFMAGVQQVVSGVVAVLHSIDKKAVQPTAATAAPKA